MKAKVVKIGNSKGIRIPKPILEQLGIVEDVDLEVGNNQIVLRPAENPRAGWDEAFSKMAEIGDDELLLGDDVAHSWDEEEWRW